MEFSCSIWCILLSCFSSLVCSQQEKLSNKLSNSNEQQHEIVISQSPFYSLNWKLKKAKNGRYEVVFKISGDSKLNWVGFGFVSTSSEDISNDDDDQTEMPSADWFIAWKDRRKRIHYKDCNTMESGLHFDKSQDYHVIAKSRPTSLNLSVKRYVDTSDDYDVKLKPGNMRMVLAYGEENSFSDIKTEMEFTRKQQNLVLFSKTELDSPVINEKETKTKPTKSGPMKISTKGKEMSLPSATSSATLVPKKMNCTVIIQEDTHWYEILKLKQENVFYAILGASAILASMIVFSLACCCAKKSNRRMAPSKMAFYKVDDDDEEQVEFLKERA